VLFIQSDSKLLSGFTFMEHVNPDNNLESSYILQMFFFSVVLHTQCLCNRIIVIPLLRWYGFISYMYFIVSSLYQHGSVEMEYMK
jgi:hypothetical protein